MSLPAEVTFGTVFGSNFAATVDGSDVDVDPDALALSGQVTFTPDLQDGRLLVTTSTPPVTLAVQPVPVEIQDGVYELLLVATDSPGCAPADWTWTATFNVTASGTPVTIPPVTFALPAGSFVDMTLVAPVPTADGWQAYASVAASAASAAASAGSAATSAADAALSASLVGAPADTIMATVVGNPASATSVSLKGQFARARQVDAKVYGAIGDGVTDDTTAIQAAITAAGVGGTVLFPPTSSFYLVTPGSLTVTTANLRLLGTPRDGYAVSMRATSGTGPILTVKAAGFVYKDIGIIGNGGVNGVGATMDGIDLFGDISANCDATIGGTLQGVAQPVKIRGRNADCSGALVSNSLNGIQLDGIDGTYHVGSGATAGNRANTIRLSRFHNIGTSSANKVLEITTTAKLLHAVIEGNYIDSNGLARHVVAAGTVTDPHNKLTIRNMKHAEAGADVYDLTYVINSTIDGVDISADVSGTPGYGRGFVLNNCTDLDISNVTALQLGQSGVYARNNTGLRFSNVKFRAIGGDPGTTAHGFDVDATNSQCSFDGIKVNGADGWGFLGSPTDSKFSTHEFRSCTLGRISSTTFGIESIWIPAVDMTITTGTPNLAALPGVGYPASWQLDSATTEQLSMQVQDTPNTWSTFDIVLWWAVTNTFTGNVVFDLTRAIMSAGVVVGVGGVTVGPIVAASPAVAGQLVATTMAAGVTRAPGPLHIRMDRAGANASDTYAADAAVVAVQLVRVT